MKYLKRAGECLFILGISPIITAWLMWDTLVGNLDWKDHIEKKRDLDNN